MIMLIANENYLTQLNFSCLTTATILTRSITIHCACACLAVYTLFVRPRRQPT